VDPVIKARTGRRHKIKEWGVYLNSSFKCAISWGQKISVKCKPGSNKLRIRTKGDKKDWLPVIVDFRPIIPINLTGTQKKWQNITSNQENKFPKTVYFSIKAGQKMEYSIMQGEDWAGNSYYHLTQR